MLGNRFEDLKTKYCTRFEGHHNRWNVDFTDSLGNFFKKSDSSMTWAEFLNGVNTEVVTFYNLIYIHVYSRMSIPLVLTQFYVLLFVLNRTTMTLVAVKRKIL